MLTRQSWLGAGRDRAAADEFGALSGEAVEGGVSGGIGSAGDGIGEQVHPSPLARALFTVAVTQALAWSPARASCSIWCSASSWSRAGLQNASLFHFGRLNALSVSNLGSQPRCCRPSPRAGAARSS